MGYSSIPFPTAPGGMFEWRVVSENTRMTENNGYIVSGAGETILTLPISAEAGSQIIISGKSGGWKVAQNEGQRIYLESAETTEGTEGFIRATHPRMSATLLCITAGTEWNVLTATGALELG